jgi:hypothetical protein
MPSFFYISQTATEKEENEFWERVIAHQVRTFTPNLIEYWICYFAFCNSFLARNWLFCILALDMSYILFMPQSVFAV